VQGSVQANDDAFSAARPGREETLAVDSIAGGAMVMNAPVDETKQATDDPSFKTVSA
jgi:hypothetical protein